MTISRLGKHFLARKKYNELWNKWYERRCRAKDRRAG